MTGRKNTPDFVTETRIKFAVNLAGDYATQDRSASAYDCAEKSVCKIFGPWLLDHTAAVRPGLLPLYLRLIDDVEQRTGLHRRRCTRRGPHDPARGSRPIAMQTLDQSIGNHAAVA